MGAPVASYFGVPALGTNILRATINMAAVGWSEIGAHRVWTVTGLVRMVHVYYVSEPFAGAGMTLSIGYTGDAAAYCSGVLVANLIAGKIIQEGAAATPYRWLRTNKYVLGPGGDDCDVLLLATNVGYTINVADTTDGTLECVCYWTPISADGNVVAGTGGAL